MKPHFRSAAIALSLLASASGAALAQEKADKAPAKTPAASSEKQPRLTVGDKAPPLTIEKWVKGEPVSGFAQNKVYVVEFWATWCGPCISAMPHLSEIQAKYKDMGLTVIGVTSVDRKGNTLEKVQQFLQSKKGERAQYAIAWDTDRTTNTAYMKAAQQSGIPCSFVIDQEGRIAFIGHPLELDEVIPAVLGRSWNISEARSKHEFRFEGDAKLDQFMAAMADHKLDEAAKLGSELVSRYFKDDSMVLNELAWTIVDPDENYARRDLDLAQRAALRAAELTENDDPSVLDTLARVHFLKGEHDKAISIQTKAVSLAEDDFKKELEATLASYRSAKESAGKK
ncbi:MAG: redoxin family protein [Planctomycetota bacterium]|nr:redoxin family protein [Planctomycetota bacterium]